MPTSTRAPSSDGLAPARPSGFTLLELAIVLLVLAIAASFVIPRLRDTDSTALQASSARLASVTRYLYEEAALRRLPMRLNLDLDRQAYWVTVFNDDPEQPAFVPDESPLSRPTALPEAVRFLDVVLPAVGTVKEGMVFAQFFPEGYADALVVHLEGRRGDRATLAIEPLTGRTRVADGYIDLEGTHDRDPSRPRDVDDAG